MIVKPQNGFLNISWAEAWTSATFRRDFLTISILFTIVLLIYPYFFAAIQQREGVVLHDFLLQFLPPNDMSIYIFSLIYFTVFIGIVRAVQYPVLFYLFLWGAFFFSLSRMLTISLVPLDPPVGLVPLVDPVLKVFYRDNNITRDLFYSGHTGSVFFIYLTLQRKWEKVFALVATILVGIFLLIQHIHYTIDVVFAPFFVYLAFMLAKKVCSRTIENL